MDDPIDAVAPLIPGWRLDAARRHIDAPVFLGLSAASPHGRAAYLALTGVELEKQAEVGEGETVDFRTVSKSSACMILALFAGDGGRSLHRRVARREGRPEHWVIVLLRHGIMAAEVRDKRSCRYEIEGYGSLPPPCPPPDGDIVTLQTRFKDGGILYYRGFSHAEAIRTMELVERILGRPVVEGFDPTAHGITDEDLTQILFDEYLEEPIAVAEAIRSLGTLPGTMDEGLVRVLQTRTALYVLSVPVFAILAGDEPRTTDW